MIVCLACYGPRLAALLENATELRFSQGGASNGEKMRLRSSVIELGLGRLVETLKAANADLLICGGITSQESEFITAGGIRVEAWVAGTADEVLSAWREGWLATKKMPGCGGTGADPGPRP